MKNAQYRIMLKSYDQKMYFDRNGKLTENKEEAFDFKSKRIAANQLFNMIIGCNRHWQLKTGIYVTDYCLEEI